ncbi:element excision factor XisH family protein [Cyanothece sp. BG0011]|uniref:element excision factor XisH family protein n=1 Tax=Cyanothece sp. BG0011 TaxID=2082950 RepID=UPI0018E540BA|nr:element excision factor XisH family protein [Cyanothece sp. BG0011]
MEFTINRLALEELEPDRILYLAIPNDIYQNFFQDSFIQKVINNYSIKLLIINPQQGEIILWKPSLINN